MPRLSVVKTVGAFLDLIGISEGTCTSPATHDAGYDIIVSGIDGPNTSSDYSAHPFAAGRAPIVVRTAPSLLESTASGRYQITLPTWREITATWSTKLFSPQQQDAAALELLRQCGALNLIDAGKIENAIEAACETWASFPGNSYGQGGRTVAWLLEKYAQQLAAQ